MEEKAKLSFVTTKFDRVFALKVSKHLPMFKGGIKYPEIPTFETIQNSLLVFITDANDPFERKYNVLIDSTSDFKPDKTEFQMNEYDVLLIGMHGRVSVIDETTYLEAYDLGSDSINRTDRQLLDDYYRKQEKRSKQNLMTEDFFTKILNN